MQSAIITTIISGILIILGLIGATYGIKQFMNDKCKKNSFTYQICGFGGSLLFVFSEIYFWLVWFH